ncbi:MAG TPA: DUF2617 family protein [Phototrophicaceae bacterium]|nr:DUF2617 family protein [Phototrophicaceae bacterium]
MSRHDNIQFANPHIPIGVAQQYPGDLVLAVFARPLPVSVTVLAHSSFLLSGCRFVFNIIGESHLVSVERDTNPIFQELLACVPLTPEVCRLYHPFPDLQPFQTKTDTYTASVHFDTLPASADGLTQYLRQQPAAALEVAFPAVDNITPVTRIWWQPTGDRVHWRTLHIYPDADHITAVWSASSFSLEAQLQEQWQKEGTNVR